MTVVWVDASAGASGDMLLGALHGAGVPLQVLRAAVDAVAPEPVGLSAEPVSRNGFAALHVRVTTAESHHHRTWRDVRDLLAVAPLAEPVRDLAQRAFELLARAEATAHGTDPLDVHFHEVGALDAIADVVGAAAGFVHLDAEQVVVSPVAVGSGSVRGAHGRLPVPPPAVAELLRGVPSYAGPPGAPETELCTPTGAAVLVTVATGWGGQPPMTTSAIGVGAGSRDPEGHANVLRLFAGTAPAAATGATDGPERLLVLETNVDDLDPRLWPTVLARLLDAGALDAWLTPVLMKKGRPAHTLSALVRSGTAAAAREVLWRETSAIGVREVAVARHALGRELVEVTVDGEPVAVKLSRHDGVVVTAQPEWDDVERAAVALGRPARDVLAEAGAAARAHLGGDR
ncbi:nickel pincer cofactor biosynthesis protein LarC [Nocardioides sp. SYSU D00038]|uniref:nickel pincer cofactor biosynthesis protein LarC n=1 Tax=Nocardioides sp. SYSU D00038 TaxID=2812554 RepID=UPI001967702A|nr:nickel pincer cofactor biosynthesis protein LarC [Nocardioides sp. SYSU D00038]